jgi:rRNA maturation RNase YbeY
MFMEMGKIKPMVSLAFEARLQLKGRRKLKTFLALLCHKENHRLHSLSIVFCSDDFLLEMNQFYLKHDYLTDIISFSLSEISAIVEGELYISIDRVRENAKTFEVSVNHELHRVIFHGVLHFCGYDDKKKSQKLIMRKKEDFYLKKYFG